MVRKFALDPYLRIFYKICGGVRRSPRQSTFFPPLPSRLIDQEIFEFLSFFDRSNKPTRFCATTRPCLTFGTPIFRRDFPATQWASLTTASNPCLAAKQGNPLQLFLKLTTTLFQHYLDLLAQLHKPLNIQIEVVLEKRRGELQKQLEGIGAAQADR